MVEPMSHFHCKMEGRASGCLQAPSMVLKAVNRALAALAQAGVASPWLEQQVLLHAAKRFGHYL
mgnify:CR=1 FL=1